jgi:uncharacterized protein (TIGR02444 family)
MATSPQSAEMPAASPELDNAFWRFAVSFYARNGVSPACLALQETLGVDVNILLFAIYAQIERGVALSAHDLAAADARVRDWRSDILQPLRRIRTRMKSGPFPAPSPTTENLRNRIKAAELQAEQIEIALLADWLDHHPPRSAPRVTDARNIPLLVARHFQPEGVFASELDAAFDTLSQAIRDASATTSHPLS